MAIRVELRFESLEALLKSDRKQNIFNIHCTNDIQTDKNIPQDILQKGLFILYMCYHCIFLLLCTHKNSSNFESCILKRKSQTCHVASGQNTEIIIYNTKTHFNCSLSFRTKALNSWSN